MAGVAQAVESVTVTIEGDEAPPELAQGHGEVTYRPGAAYLICRKSPAPKSRLCGRIILTVEQHPANMSCNDVLASDI